MRLLPSTLLSLEEPFLSFVPFLLPPFSGLLWERRDFLDSEADPESESDDEEPCASSSEEEDDEEEDAEPEEEDFYNETEENRGRWSCGCVK